MAKREPAKPAKPAKPSKREYEGLKPGYFADIASLKGKTPNEDFLKKYVWWWHWPKNSVEGLPPELSDEFQLLFDTQYRRSACNYELGARFLGKYEFDDIWLNLSEHRKAMLTTRWPEDTLKDISTIASVADGYPFAKPGWSKPERLSFNLTLPNDTLVKDLRLRLDRWRREMGIEKPAKHGDKTLFWDVIEYMDRKYLLGERRESDRESAVAKKRQRFLRDVVNAAADSAVVAALKRYSSQVTPAKKPTLTPPVRDALRRWITAIPWCDSAPLIDPPTDADVARQGLLVLAEDPAAFEEICHFLTDKMPEPISRVPTSTLITAALSVIQSVGHFESGGKGKLDFMTPKAPPRNSPLVPLVKYLISDLKGFGPV